MFCVYGTDAIDLMAEILRAGRISVLNKIARLDHQEAVGAKTVDYLRRLIFIDIESARQGLNGPCLLGLVTKK